MAAISAGYVRQYIWTGVAGSPYYTTLYGTGEVTAEEFATVCNQFFDDIKSSLIVGTRIASDGVVYAWDAALQEKIGAAPVDEYVGLGTATGEALPTQTQFLISWATGEYVDGKEVRGRTYLGAQTENSNTAAGDVVGTTVSAFQTAAGDLANAEILCINSPKHGALFQVTRASTTNMWATQRTRSKRG